LYYTFCTFSSHKPLLGIEFQAFTEIVYWLTRISMFKLRYVCSHMSTEPNIFIQLYIWCGNRVLILFMSFPLQNLYFETPIARMSQTNTLRELCRNGLEGLVTGRVEETKGNRIRSNKPHGCRLNLSQYKHRTNMMSCYM